MFFEFVSHFYKNEVKVDDEKIKNLLNTFKGAVVTQSWAEKNFTSTDYLEDKLIKEKEEITNPAIMLEHWKNYEYGPINFTQKYFEETERLNLLIASPLIHANLKDELVTFDELVKDNLTLIGVILNEVAQELPQKFPNAASIKKFEPGGIWNRYNRKKKDFEPVSIGILKNIREYLKIDKLID